MKYFLLILTELWITMPPLDLGRSTLGNLSFVRAGVHAGRLLDEELGVRDSLLLGEADVQLGHGVNQRPHVLDQVGANDWPELSRLAVLLMAANRTQWSIF